MENNLAGDAAVTDTAAAESLRKRLAEVERLPKLLFDYLIESMNYK